MSSFEKLCCAFGEVTSAALTDEFAMQTRQPQSSFFCKLEIQDTAHWQTADVLKTRI